MRRVRGVSRFLLAVLALVAAAAGAGAAPVTPERALAVATYCLDMPGLSGEMKAKLQKIMTATGRSESDLVYNANGSENKEASRRVEFKFRLIDTQMLQQMNDILSAGSAYMP